MKRSATRDALMTLLAPIAWGTTYVTVTELLPSGRPFTIALARMLPAGMMLAALGWARGRPIPRGADWWRLGALAGLNFGLFFPLLIVGVYRLPGGVAAAVGGIQPLLVGVLTRLTTGRTMRRVDVAVGIIAASGVGLVVIRRDAGIDPVGVLAAIGANLSFALGIVMTKHSPPPGDRISSTGWQLLLASVALAPLALATEGVPATITGTHVVGFLHLSVVATGGAFVVWFRGIRRLPSQAPPVLGLAAPLTGAALGWFLLGQDLSPSQLVGFAVTAGAVAYAATLGSREELPDAPPPTSVEDRRAQRAIA